MLVPVPSRSLTSRGEEVQEGPVAVVLAGHPDSADQADLLPVVLGAFRLADQVALRQTAAPVDHLRADLGDLAVPADKVNDDRVVRRLGDLAVQVEEPIGTRPL